MEGYLFQIIGDDVEELYWFPIDIDEDIIKNEYQDFINNGYDDFEDHWNENNEKIKIERIFVNEVII